jgi:predicted secreted protein
MTFKDPTMSTTTVIAIYFLIWWVVLFAVLPFGVRSQHEGGGEIAPGTDPGAPLAHRMWRSLGWTTVVATVIFVALVAIYRSGLIPFDWLMAISEPPRRY